MVIKKLLGYQICTHEDSIRKRLYFKDIYGSVHVRRIINNSINFNAITYIIKVLSVTEILLIDPQGSQHTFLL